MAVSVAGRFFGHAYFHLSRDGGGRVFEVEGGAGAIDGCCTTTRGQPKRERDGVGGRRRGATAGLYLNTVYLRDCELQI